jgi:hypothetical protein
VSDKASEEGWFWEWRTFGPRPEFAAEVLEGTAIRGSANLICVDEYFISTNTDQNVKLRGSQLKLKPLLARLPDGIELYEESARLLFEIPIDAEGITKAASLLGVDIPEVDGGERDAIVPALASAPGVSFITVRKRRTQYALGDGWAELAELEFPSGPTWSLGVQSPSIQETRRLRDLLDPEGALEPMGYVEACRRWGRNGQR